MANEGVSLIDDAEEIRQLTVIVFKALISSLRRFISPVLQMVNICIIILRYQLDYIYLDTRAITCLTVVVISFMLFSHFGDTAGRFVILKLQWNKQIPFSPSQWTRRGLEKQIPTY